MNKLMIFTILAVSGLFLFSSCEKDTIPEPTCKDKLNGLTINQLQILGSHNSYRQKTYLPILEFLAAPPFPLPAEFAPEEWDYDHIPLKRQFDEFGIRSIELDVFYDPDGGLFANRPGNGFVGEDPASGEPALDEPGLKVLHFPDADYLSHHLTFKDALQTVKDWSDGNPNHLPLMIMVEPKEDNPNALVPGLGLTETTPFDKTALGTIDEEIKDIFGESLDKVITPNEVRGSFATLNEAVRSNNWPTLGDSRGKVLFIMLGSGNEANDYADGHPSLEGRAMFIFSDEEKDYSAFIKIDNPTDEVSRIQELVNKGYIVRTRADANTIEARTGETTRREAAFESGAQIISTDYYQPDPRSGTSEDWTNYFVELPGGKLALINPFSDGDTSIACEIEE